MASSMRTYGDGCTSAHALDLVGERWALLIVRDLLFGPKRFTDLRVGLPQGSPNVLSQRLKELEESGVVRRRKLPPPASAMVYELTEWGSELEPVLLGLQRWGGGSPAFAHDVPLGCDAAMLALKNVFDPAAAGDLALRVEVRFETATFRVEVANGVLAISRGAADEQDVAVTTDPETLESVAFGLQTLRAAERAGRLEVDGDHRLLQRFFEVFQVSV